MKKLPANIQVLLTPLALVLVLIVLAVVIFNVGIAKISSQNAQVSAAHKSENVLSQRISVLEQVSGTVTSQAKAADAAVPNMNSGLLALSQLKELAVKVGVTIADFKIGAEQQGTAGLSQVNLAISIEGPFSSIINFVNQLNSIAPIVVPGKIQITTSGGLSRGEITVSSYFGLLPTKLPALTEAVTQLTSGEMDVVTKISSLTQPTFLELSPQPPAPRSNPF